MNAHLSRYIIAQNVLFGYFFPRKYAVFFAGRWAIKSGPPLAAQPPHKHFLAGLVALDEMPDKLQRVADDEEHRRLTRRLSIVQNEADRVRQILDDFLRYAGHYELSLSNVDLRDVVSELRDFFLPQAEASGAVLRTTECHDPLPCCLDVKLFKQAVLNLLLNATQAMPNGGELLVKISRNNELGCVEIIDTGAGIPPEQLETIFQPYWSTKKGGSGLGLPTARRILREHGGTMKVESDVGKGTRFVLSVPLRKTPTKKG